jgi:hypothetical protein
VWLSLPLPSAPAPATHPRLDPDRDLLSFGNRGLCPIVMAEHGHQLAPTWGLFSVCDMGQLIGYGSVAKELRGQLDRAKIRPAATLSRVSVDEPP